VTKLAVKCPACGSKRLYRDGLRYLPSGATIQRWLCRNCGLRFSESKIKLDVGSQIFEAFDSRDDNHEQRIITLNGSFKEVPDNPSFPVGENVASHSLAVVGKGLSDLPYCSSKHRIGVTETKVTKNLVTVRPLNEGQAGATATIDAKSEFAEQLKRDGYSYDTIRQCNHYLRLFEKKGVNILRPEDVKTFIAEQKWQNHSKATAVTNYGIFATYMHLHWTPPHYKYDQKIPFIPTEKEINDLIAGCGKKTSLLLRLLKETGARVTEALRIKWADLDLEKGAVTINSPEKNSYPRILKISDTLIAMLKSVERKSDCVINRSRNSVESTYQQQRNELARKLGNPRLKQIHLHTFRHFYATMLYAKTLNLLKVQQALGHKYLTNTQIYIQLINFESDEYDVQVAENLEEAKKLLEVGFDYVTEVEGRKLFRKRK
jgi:integrase